MQPHQGEPEAMEGYEQTGTATSGQILGSRVALTQTVRRLEGDLRNAHAQLAAAIAAATEAAAAATAATAAATAAASASTSGPVPAPPPAPPAPRQRMPALAVFSGERKRYRAWRTQVRLKMDVDGEALGGEKARIGVVQAALTGTAESNCTAVVHRMLEGEQTPSVDRLLAYLDGCYADNHEEERAKEELWGLHQGKKAFAAFLPEFERLLMEAGGASWHESTRLDHLRRSTADRIKDACVSAPRPTTYADMVELYSRVDADLSRPRYGDGPQPRSRTGQWSHVGQAGGQARDPDAMDWEPTPVVARTGSMRNPRGHPQGPGLPTDAQLRGKTARWAPDAEFARRRAAGACLRCNRQGCRVMVCPLAAAPRPEARQTPMTRARAAYVELALGDVVGPESGEGGFVVPQN